jgi:NAD(P)-dependent dehydrogenase (short-subunit alcohol dehydrogenase family)
MRQWRDTYSRGFVMNMQNTTPTAQATAAAYDFHNRTMFVTGGFGVLGGAMALALAGHGANVAVLSRRPGVEARLAERFGDFAGPGCLWGVEGDVLDPAALAAAVEKTLERFGAIDGLINAAGGNRPEAITNSQRSFFDLPPEALRWVVDLNLLGAILPSQVVGRHMAGRRQGVILNITSMAAITPLTRVVAYGAAKAAVSNFTQWLAVYMAQEFGPAIRVNALAPGFFLGEQNRDLLVDRATGDLTARGRQIIDHTPMGRFGDPTDLIGPMLWLLSPAAAFVTGIVVPVDGGFAAYGGV